MVCKELKMNFNAAFSTITPSFTRVLLGVFFFFFKYFSKQIGNILGIIKVYILPSFFREERIRLLWQKKRFSLLLEQRRITRRLTACLIVNRSTGALTANALTANLQKNTRNMESFFFFLSLMALSNTGMGFSVAFSPSSQAFKNVLGY